MFTTRENLIRELPQIPPHLIVETWGTDQERTEVPHFVDVVAKTREQAELAMALDGEYHHENHGHVVTFINENVA